MNILLGLTGSVATTIAPKIIKAMINVNNCCSVKVIMTEKAKMFYNHLDLWKADVNVIDDSYEWTDPQDTDAITINMPVHMWKKDDPVRHVELAKHVKIFVTKD